MCNELLRNLLTSVVGAVGSRQYRRFYLHGVDILNDGHLACAHFVSKLLLTLNAGLIREPHATVTSTVKDMEKCGWYKIDVRKEGCVIVWNPINNGGAHLHIGFYIGSDQAVSNRSSTREIGMHSIFYSGFGDQKATIAGLYWHPALD